MKPREQLLAHPPVTLRRVMDHLDQDVDLLCDLAAEFGLVDLMLEGQEHEHLAELVGYLDPLLACPDVSEDDLRALLDRCRGEPFEATARASLTKLLSRARQTLAGELDRPTLSA